VRALAEPRSRGDRGGKSPNLPGAKQVQAREHRECRCKSEQRSHPFGHDAAQQAAGGAGAAICPKRRLAVRGSNRSLATSQNPDPSIGPTPEICRYTTAAATRGATATRAHSTSSRVCWPRITVVRMWPAAHDAEFSSSE
jgi:hypothetical protein